MKLAHVFALSLLALASACGGQSSSTPPPDTSGSSEPAEGEPTSSASSSEAEGSSPPPQCVPVGERCEANAYCCYGVCRAEDGSPELRCRP